MSELVWDLQDASEFYEAIQRVRELHKPFMWDFTPGVFCSVCLTQAGKITVQVDYPCPTIQALDGDQ